MVGKVSAFPLPRTNSGTAYATTLYNAKIDAKTAQSLLGHSSVSVTLDVYTHISKNVADGAKEQLNNYISQSKFSQKS